MTHLIDPDGNITEYPAILREIEMPQGLFDLLEGANRLELLLPGVLLQVVKDSKHVGKPQGFDLKVIFYAVVQALTLLLNIAKTLRITTIMVAQLVCRVAASHPRSVQL